jgi:cytochrome c556
VARDEVEAAYFTLLRAREEVSALQRYGEVLHDEVRRLRRFRSEGAALAGRADPRLWRAVAHSESPLTEALDLRQRVLADEQQRLPERITAAEAFVAECEAAHDALRHRS